jgi:hypothetical protein
MTGFDLRQAQTFRDRAASMELDQGRPHHLPQRSDQEQARADIPYRENGNRGNRGTDQTKRSKDKADLDTKSGVTDWAIHDLRRTLVSNWAAMGIRQEVTEKYINHVSGSFGGIVGVYQRHTFMGEMRDALKLWEAKLSSLVP